MFLLPILILWLPSIVVPFTFDLPKTLVWEVLFISNIILVWPSDSFFVPLKITTQSTTARIVNQKYLLKFEEFDYSCLKNTSYVFQVGGLAIAGGES